MPDLSQKPAAVGFNNGLGNFIIFTQVLQALCYHTGHKVTLVLDKDATGTGIDAAREIGSRLECVERVIYYQTDFQREDYGIVYASLHSNGGMMHADFTSGRSLSYLDSWAESFISESCFYYMELRDLYGYRGPVFPQVVRYDWRTHDQFLHKHRKRPIMVANGYIRSQGGGWDRKLYPHWADVIEAIVEFYPDRKVYLLGGREDQEWAEGICKKLPMVVSLAGRLSILESISCLATAKAFLSNDTGLLHCADALRVPSIGVFGSTLVSKNGPLNGETTIIRSPLRCAPCQGTIQFFTCDNPHLCMDAIPPEWIVGAFRALMRKLMFK